MIQARQLKQQRVSLQINYLYFGLIFAVLLFVHVSSVAVASVFSQASPWRYIAHVFLQVGVESYALAYIAAVLHRKKWKIFEMLFVIATFLLTFGHCIDFHLVRLMDLSIWFALDFVVDEPWTNFYEMLLASNIVLQTWVYSTLAVIGCALGALWIFYRRIQATALSTSVVYSVCGLGVLLSACDCLALRDVDTADMERYAKALPWKRTFFMPPAPGALERELTAPMQEEEFQTACQARQAPLVRNPNIFLFVIESLRETFLTSEVAPYLAKFKADSIFIPHTYACADATQISWYSLFFSQIPLRWGDARVRSWNAGSGPLQILKNAGYAIHVYSASRLAYYKMDEKIFGKDHGIAQDVFINLSTPERSTWQCDLATNQRLLRDMEKYEGEQGHCFIVFIESTHFDYSWPGEDTLFLPVIERTNFLKAAFFQENLEGVKNRYRNAVHYVDGLFGNVLQSLEQSGQLDRSVVVVTADHAEEFFEKGHLFHASGLTEEQIAVPIYYSFPKLEETGLIPHAHITSHVDIFPSILHYLYGEDYWGDLFEGDSIFLTHRRDYTISGRFNASRTPHEFCVHTKDGKCLVRFADTSSPYRSSKMYVLHAENYTGYPIVAQAPQIHRDFSAVLDKVFPPKKQRRDDREDFARMVLIDDPDIFERVLADQKMR